MKTWNSVKAIGAVVVAALLAASQASGTIVYTTPSGLLPNEGAAFSSPWNLGLDFTVNNAGGYVTAIGAYDDYGNGFLGGNVPVAIYTSSGTQVAGTLVTFSGTSGTLSGQTRFVGITPVFLAPGTYSIVGANFGELGGNDNFNSGISAASPSNPGFDTVGGNLTMLNSFRYGTGASLFYPTDTVGYGTYGPGDPRWSAGSFDFTPVPEVAHFALAGVGLLGLVYIGRYARLRRIIKPA